MLYAGSEMYALEVFLNDMRYINPRFTYLLTYVKQHPHAVCKSKLKFSHTCYRALGPELIPVYRQSARR